MRKNASQYWRHLILLHPGDFARIGELHGTSKPTQIIRRLVRLHIEAVERRLAEAQQENVE